VRIIKVKNYEALSIKAARIVAGQIELKPNLVLGLSTDSTSQGMFENLTKIHKQDNLSFNYIKVFKLDEFVGIKKEHPGSLNTYIQREFLDKVDIRTENFHTPNGYAEDIKKECHRYENKIKEVGGIDFLVLGIGENGNIAFLEPGNSLPLKTSTIKLSEKTRETHSSNFDSLKEVPTKAITMGLDTILSADEILLLASGKSKAEAVKKMLSREVSIKTPASLLNLHRNITVLIDKQAGKNMK